MRRKMKVLGHLGTPSIWDDTSNTKIGLRDDSSARLKLGITPFTNISAKLESSRQGHPLSETTLYASYAEPIDSY